MKGFRFYEEFTDTKRNVSRGTIVAVEYGTYWISKDDIMIEALNGVVDVPNTTMTCWSGVSDGYLRSQCKRVSEKKAREIHPNLFSRLDFDIATYNNKE